MHCRLRFLSVSILLLAICALPLGATPPDQKAQTKAAPTKKPATTAKSAETSTVSTATVSVNGINDIDPEKSFGSKSAPVTMEVFSDFQCPACKQLYITTMQRVVDNYVNTGKIYLVHRDFPLPMHAYSRVAASYARAAAHVGKCEAVENALFQNQEKWEKDGDIKGILASVLSAAEMKKVQGIVDAKTLEPMIEKDKQLGQGYAITQTPTTWLHTKTGQAFPVVGYVSYDVLKSFLDQIVSQK